MIEIFDNIRKIYRFSPACEELSDYVEFFSESSAELTQSCFGNKGFTVKMFPSWTPTFWFNLGSPYRIKSCNKEFNIPKHSDILLLRDVTVERLNEPTDYIFTVKFYPGGLESIFDIDQSKLQTKIVDLKTILPVSLMEEIRICKDFTDRMQLLQHYFLLHLQKKKKRDHYMYFIKQTIASYEEHEMKLNVNELSAKLFTSSKTINRYFNNIVGLSPRKYFSILRARTALTAWTTDKHAFLPTAFGYYDASHFYKEMERFTGQKLSVFYHRPNENPG